MPRGPSKGKARSDNEAGRLEHASDPRKRKKNKNEWSFGGEHLFSRSPLVCLLPEVSLPSLPNSAPVSVRFSICRTTANVGHTAFSHYVSRVRPSALNSNTDDVRYARCIRLPAYTLVIVTLRRSLSPPPTAYYYLFLIQHVASFSVFPRAAGSCRRAQAVVAFTPSGSGPGRPRPRSPGGSSPCRSRPGSGPR